MIKIEGLDELQEKLEVLTQKVHELDGQNIPMSEVLAGDFISRSTKFSSLAELLEASGFKIESQDDFAAIPVNKLDRFIRSNSPFDSWNALLSTAGSEWAKKKIGLK